MAHPFISAARHDPHDSFRLHLFARYEPLPPGHVMPVIAAYDADNKTWILLCPPGSGIPIQHGLVIKGYTTDTVVERSVVHASTAGGPLEDCVEHPPSFHAIVDGPIDFDRNYIVFTLYDPQSYEILPFDFAVPHNWAWIREELQVMFATHHQSEDDHYHFETCLLLEEVLVKGRIQGEETYPELAMNPFPFDEPLRPHSLDHTRRALRRTRSLPTLHGVETWDLKQVEASEDRMDTK